MTSRYLPASPFSKKLTKSRGRITKAFPYDIEIPFNDNDVYYRVSNITSESLPILAKRYYNDASYWWVILAANKDKGYATQWDIQVNDVIRIPSDISFLFNSVRERYKKGDK